MPAFTAVATAIVSYAFYGTVGLTFAAGTIGAFVVSVVATGLAYATTSLLNKSGSGSGGTSQDPGVRIQLPPATNNKIPIVYGTSYTKGVITDARISNENKTMTYVLVLSEETQTGSFSVGDMFWNDSLLQFKAAPDGHIVSGSIDQAGKGTTSTNFADLIRIRVYAGSTDSADQIFPTSGTPVNARTLLDESDTNYQLNGLVFAVVQVDYNQEKNVVALANMTFQLTNSLNNPGLVWYDYMTSTRYGAGIPSAQVDTVYSISTASNSLYTISNEIPSNQFQSNGTTPSSQPRYQINGVLSTGVNVKSNIQRINDASASWTAYDISDGKWRVIPNRVASAGEISAAQAFNDDNIIGDVGVTATNLEDLFNILEVEYPSRTIRDQDDYYRNSIASNDRNQLEPNNVLNLRLDLVNNALHAGRIGLIQLKQSRVDLIITFRADYTALQAEAGDLIAVTNDVYGFVNKILRVTKLREVEDESGTLTVEVTALEYNATVYTDETLVDGAAPQASGIPQFGSSTTLPAPSAPVISNINPTSNVPNFTISTTIAGTSGPVSIVEWFYSSSASGTYVYLANERPASGNFSAGATVSDEIFNLDAGTWYFKARTGSGGLYSDFSAASAALIWTPTPGGANNGTISTATNALDILVIFSF